MKIYLPKRLISFFISFSYNLQLVDNFCFMAGCYVCDRCDSFFIKLIFCHKNTSKLYFWNGMSHLQCGFDAIYILHTPGILYGVKMFFKNKYLHFVVCKQSLVNWIIKCGSVCLRWTVKFRDMMFLRSVPNF